MLRKGGGEVVRGLGMAELLLALLELFLLRPFFKRLRWKVFIRLAWAGEKLLLHMMVLWFPNGVVACGLVVFRTCGVVRIWSSMSSITSSSLVLSSLSSSASMLILPTLLLTALRSFWAWGQRFGESSIMLFTLGFRALCVMIGDELGEGLSARVE